MIWIARTAKDTGNAVLEKRIWDSAEQFRANSGLPGTGNASARELEATIASNVAEILES